MTMAPGCTAEDRRAYLRLVRRMTRIVVAMEELGENEMGVLDRRTAMRFHRLTHRLRLFSIDLVNDAMVEEIER